MTEPQERTVPAIRPYVITGGRAEAEGPTLSWESLVIATALEGDTGTPGEGGVPGDVAVPGEGRVPGDVAVPSAARVLQPEHRDILAHCQGLISVGEVAAHIGQPLPVVRVLLSDLLAWDLILTRPPVRRAERTDMSLLQRILDGLEQHL